MLNNYLKIALRNLSKHKTFSVLNIFGLALSMSVCLLIIMLIKDAYSFDLFHPESDRVYRILTLPDRKDGRTENYASSPFIVGKTLAEDYPQVEIWTPVLRNFGGRINNGDKQFDFNGLLTDLSFFDMFGFELAEGDPETALSDPFSIVLAHDLALRMFNNETPIGKTFKIQGYDTDFTVTGVLKEFPGKTHLEFTALGSLATQLALEKLPDANPITSDWTNYYTTYNFVRLKDAGDKKAAELALADIGKTHYAGLELESRDQGYNFSLQPLGGITPDVGLSNSMGAGMPKPLIWFLTALGAIIMLSACFNYTNLTIARSLIRTKEVGVRKVLGATRRQVFYQFIGEAVMASVLALVIAYQLMWLVKNQFERLSFTEFLDVSMKPDALLFVQFLLFATLVGLVAGLLPALTLSKTSPLAILQKLQNVKFMQRLGLRRVLLVTQFSITLIFFILVTISWKQGEHAISTNFGFDEPQTLVVELQGQPYDKVLAAMQKVSGVEKISAISFPMGTWLDSKTDIRTKAENEKIGVRDYFIDHQYLDHFGIELLAGENFPDNPSQQQELFAIVNETLVNEFQLGEPNEAVGKSIIIGDSTQVSIRGVVKDFAFKPANYAMEPLLLRYAPADLGFLNVRITGTEPAATVTALGRTWKQLETALDFNAQFYDEKIRETYASMVDLTRIVGFFGVLGMVIACMGLLGMAIYTVETKSKEISIRKVMGAGAKDVVLMLSKSYLILFGIAVLIATPICFLLGKQMLQTFAERIALTPWLFLPGVLLLLLVAGLTVGSQTLRAAFANPVKALRSE